jgi:hypothetical protein
MTLEGGGGGGGMLGGITSALGSVAKGVTDVVKGVVQPVYNATLKHIPGVDNALVNLDKSVGKAIPGGWGTVAAVASSFIPGAALATMGMTQTGLATGLGALSGSGVMHKGNQFNLQGAILGGAMAYGASTLSSAYQNAGQELANTPTGAVSDSISKIAGDSGSALSGTNSANIGSNIASNGSGGAGLGNGYGPVNSGIGGLNPTQTPLSNIGFTAPTNAMNVAPGVDIPSGIVQAAQPAPSMLENATNTLTNLPSNIADKATSAYDTLTNPDTYSNLGSKTLDTAKGTVSNMGDAVSGVGKVLSGSASLPAGTLINAGVPLIVGASGLKALEEQQKYLDQQLAAGNIAQDQYNAEKAKIDEEIATANKVVSDNPLHATTDQSTINEGPSLYAKTKDGTLYDKNPSGGSQLLYAMGGTVSNPPDDQTGMPNQTPLQNFEQGGMYGLGGMAPNQPMSYPGYAAGGMAPRFLSGGGDGMSDSIPANIGGKQEARLADGEFVIPADVVSHLGNGSSKAGAKQLYSMMDKVRKARTGRESQGKQINPRKYMPV